MRRRFLIRLLGTFLLRMRLIYADALHARNVSDTITLTVAGARAQQLGLSANAPELK